MGTFSITKEQLEVYRAARKAKQAIALGEIHVEQSGLTAARLVTLMDALMQAKDTNTLGNRPKLVALYSWLQEIKGMAVAGVSTFPPIPHTFEEVISEQPIDSP
jgi:hypothetical protein